VSRRSVFARRCSRETATLDGCVSAMSCLEVSSRHTGLRRSHCRRWVTKDRRACRRSECARMRQLRHAGYASTSLTESERRRAVAIGKHLI
jgi:hypothetical protein